MLARHKPLACLLNNLTATVDKLVFRNQSKVLFLPLSLSPPPPPALAFLQHLFFFFQLLLLLLIYALHVLGQNPGWQSVALTEVYMRRSTQDNSQ